MPGTVVVANANDAIEAAIWADALAAAGIAAATFERGPGAAFGGASGAGLSAYPILVSRGDLARARSVIADVAGGSAIAPVPDEAAATARRVRILTVAAVAIAVFLAGGFLLRALGA
ncbi:MAG TPA: hypothetical protein VFK32_08580 [Tepidiformaceae bacterium]|nr:hypothetical protein [Tepidiformaceae bacterium]